MSTGFLLPLFHDTGLVLKRGLWIFCQDNCKLCHNLLSLMKNIIAEISLEEDCQITYPTT